MNSVHCMNNLVNRIMDEREDERRCTIVSGECSDSSIYSMISEKRRTRVIQDEIEIIVSQLPSILVGYLFQVWTHDQGRIHAEKLETSF